MASSPILSNPEVILTHSPSPAWRCSRYNLTYNFSQNHCSQTNQLLYQLFSFLTLLCNLSLFIFSNLLLFTFCYWISLNKLKKWIIWCIMRVIAFFYLSILGLLFSSPLMIMGMASILLLHLYLCINFDFYLLQVASILKYSRVPSDCFLLLNMYLSKSESALCYMYSNAATIILQYKSVTLTLLSLV